MATGFTDALYEGKNITFPEFAMKCARAFGALVEMRDEPLDVKIPDEFQSSDHHINSLKQAKQRLAEVRKWSDRQAENKARELYQGALSAYQQAVKHREVVRKSYEEMLAKVRGWSPPTPEHKDLRNFMVEQLLESIRMDCDPPDAQPKRLSGAEYKRFCIKEAENDIKYHAKHYQEEVRAAKERTEWVRALRKSLGIK